MAPVWLRPRRSCGSSWRKCPARMRRSRTLETQVAATEPLRVGFRLDGQLERLSRAEGKPRVVTLVENRSDRVLPSRKGTAKALVANTAGGLVEVTDEKLARHREVGRVLVVGQVRIVEDRLHIKWTALGMLACGRNEDAVAAELVAASAARILGEENELTAGWPAMGPDDRAILNVYEVARMTLEDAEVVSRAQRQAFEARRPPGLLPRRVDAAPPRVMSAALDE